MQNPTVLALLGSLLLATLPAKGAAPPAAGDNFQVNAVTQGTQAFPTVAQDTAGDSVVVWLDQGAAPVTVKARRFDATGAPAGGEIVVGAADASTFPRVAMMPLGAFAVVWLQGHQVTLRRYDRLGRPEGDAVPAPQAAGETAVPTADVALDPAGNAFVVWAVSRLGGEDILLQRFDAASQPFGAREKVNQINSGLRSSPRVAVNAADSVLVSWDDARSLQTDCWARRFDGPAAAWALEVRVSANDFGIHGGGTPLLYPAGDGAIVFTDFATGAIRARRLDPHGVPLGAEIPVAAADSTDGLPATAAAGADGTALVAWQGQDVLVHAAFFDRAWNPLGADFTPSSGLDDAQVQPAAAAGGAGSLLLVWAEAGPSFPVLQPPGTPTGRDGSDYGVFAQRFQTPACAAGSDHLCLGQALAPGGGPLFDVQVSWRNPYTGETGTGKSRPLTGDTGAFWFFDPANLELMIKILDGRAVNGYFWVFYGSLSNVEYTIAVTETLTGAVKTYHNAPLHFASQADVQAFLLVSAAPASPASAAAPPPASLAAAPFAAGDCTPTPTTLCPQSRFRAAVTFTDPRTGVSGPGAAVTLSDDSGIFWFFDPTNLELMVKVLDGGAINGRFWVFYGGLSDVDYTLTVTDTATGTQRIYHNPQHHLASAADLDAFPAGPTAGN